MPTNEQYIKEEIMRRVKFIAFLNKFFFNLRAKIAWFFILFGFGSVLSAEVSLQSVEQNLFQIKRAGELVKFSFNAFISTEFAVQAFVIVMSVLSIVIMKDMIKYSKADFYHLIDKIIGRSNMVKVRI
ncbi:MAG: hypothetical protein WCT19_02985 [Candidatus Paceibacterota bacterium]|jgi:hypothetical protein